MEEMYIHFHDFFLVQVAMLFNSITAKKKLSWMALYFAIANRETLK